MYADQKDFTHDGGGSCSHHAVEDEWRNEAVLLDSRVGLHELGVVAEEALDVDAENIGALKVVGQQHRACHDDQLERKRSARHVCYLHIIISIIILNQLEWSTSPHLQKSVRFHSSILLFFLMPELLHDSFLFYSHLFFCLLKHHLKSCLNALFAKLGLCIKKKKRCMVQFFSRGAVGTK